MTTIRERLHALGLTLPEPTPTGFSYVPLSVHQGVAYLAGQIPKTAPDRVRAAGTVGAEVSVEEARADAGLCIRHGLAWLEHRLGALESVERPLSLTVYVAAAPDCDRISEVADGASRLLIELFGEEKGPHPRSVIGVHRLPRAAPVMVDGVFALT
jgi:enamine deaminase RidA (YjgF/YER057c/UK114 family)